MAWVATGCAHHTPALADAPVMCRSIVKMKDERVAPSGVASRLHLDLESAVAMGEGHYKIVIRSHSEADCEDSLARFNADQDVNYAVTDDRKRSH
jgi:hypothetical protein